MITSHQITTGFTNALKPVANNNSLPTIATSVPDPDLEIRGVEGEGVGGGGCCAVSKKFLDPPLDLWLCDRIFLFVDRQSSTAQESFFASLWRLPRLSYSLVFCTCSSVRWISWAVPFACWEEKPLAKPSLRMKFLATPWLALWLASWQLSLFKARPLQLPSWSQWWLLAVSLVCILQQQCCMVLEDIYQTLL